MNEWSIKTLRDVSTNINYGYTASATDVDTGVKFLRITDIVNQPFDWSSVPYCEISKRDAKKYKLEKGDIVIARTGATTGTTFIYEHNVEAVFASYLIRYSINTDLANPKFISYQLKSDNWRGFVDNIIGGSAQPGANANQFASYEFALPPLTQQQAIAEVLSSLDDKIDLLHRNNKTLDEMADIQFQQMFTDCADADLIDEFEITMGQSPPGTSYNEDCVGIEFYQGCTDFGYRFPTPRVYCTDPKRFAKKFDVLLSVRAPVGDINIAFNDCCIGRGLAALRHRNSEVHYSYAYRLLKSIRVAFDLHEETGTIFGAIGKDDLYKIKCPILTTEGVSKYNTKIAAFEDKITSNKLQIKCLASVRDLLLPKLMSGALRVKDFTHELSVL